jgi:hypothetical protein
MTTVTTPEPGFPASGVPQQFVDSANKGGTHHWIPNPDWRWWAFWRERETLWTLSRSRFSGGSGAEVKLTLHTD